MAVDTLPVGSPGWWLKRLGDRLLSRRDGYDLLDRYFTGEQAVPALAGKATKQAFRDLMAMARTNYAELVVEAVRERMTPVGFRTGAGGDELGDKEAWSIWQANALDADSALVHRTSLSLGDAFVIVGAVDEEIGAPLITPEDPREVITEQDPRRRRRTLAALKLYHDDVQGEDVAFVYLPGQVYRFKRERVEVTATGEREPIYPISAQGWSADGSLDLPEPLEKLVPVVEFANRATMFHGVAGEFEPHLGLLDRINFTILQRLEIATLQAFRQRAIKGVEPTDENGEKIDFANIFTYDPGALWLLPETAELWESGQVDLGPIRQAIRDDVQDLAAVTRTPLFYLTPDASNGSAEGASLAREGLTFKAQDRIVQAGESWEAVMSLAFLMTGDTARAARSDMEVLWADPERVSMAERYDAAVKAQAAGVPWRSVMAEILQFSPQEVERMEAERVTDSLLSEPLPLPTQTPPGPAAAAPAAPAAPEAPVPAL